MCINKLINKINNMNEKWSQKGLITDVSETTEVLILNGTPLNNKRIKFLDFIKTINNESNIDLSNYVLKSNPTFTATIRANNGEIYLDDALIEGNNGKISLPESSTIVVSPITTDNSTKIATTAFVKSVVAQSSINLSDYALKNNSVLTGNVSMSANVPGLGMQDYFSIDGDEGDILLNNDTGKAYSNSILSPNDNSARIATTEFVQKQKNNPIIKDSLTIAGTIYNGSPKFSIKDLGENAGLDITANGEAEKVTIETINNVPLIIKNPTFIGETTVPINNKFSSVFQLKKNGNIYKHLIIEEDFSSLSVNQNKYLSLDVDNSILKHDINNYLELGGDNAGIKSNVEFDINAPIIRFTGNVVVPNGDAANEAVNKGQLDAAIQNLYVIKDVNLSGVTDSLNSIYTFSASGDFDISIVPTNIGTTIILKNIGNNTINLFSGGTGYLDGKDIDITAAGTNYTFTGAYNKITLYKINNNNWITI